MNKNYVYKFHEIFEIKSNFMHKLFNQEIKIKISQKFYKFFVVVVSFLLSFSFLISMLLTSCFWSVIHIFLCLYIKFLFLIFPCTIKSQKSSQCSLGWLFLWFWIFFFYSLSISMMKCTEIIQGMSKLFK